MSCIYFLHKELFLRNLINFVQIKIKMKLTCHLLDTNIKFHHNLSKFGDQICQKMNTTSPSCIHFMHYVERMHNYFSLLHILRFQPLFVFNFNNSTQTATVYFTCDIHYPVFYWKVSHSLNTAVLTSQQNF